eukprot:GHVP01050271.1.p1 GENE.GHVP01050271.1~~GHVP01050271.1.p1  ORF type:complete len:995 (-),score=151.64 GHVP01050271.1:61-3009(-)
MTGEEKFYDFSRLESNEESFLNSPKSPNVPKGLHIPKNSSDKNSGQNVNGVDSYIELPTYRDSAVSTSNGQKVPQRFKLPAPGDYSHRSQIYRLKGSWSKKWSKELLIVQHNVLLTCSKESPFLVKLCIPLKNIQSISPQKDGKKKEAQNIVLVDYIEAGKKATPHLTSMKVRTETDRERSDLISKLETFKTKAMQSEGSLMDYVVRENAEVMIKNMHTIMKNSGQNNTVLRVYNMLKEKNHNHKMEAFYLLKLNWQSDIVKKERAAAEKKKAEAEAEAKKLKSETTAELNQKEIQKRSQLAVFKLSNLFASKQSSYMRSILWGSELVKTKNLAERTGTLMTNTMIDQTEDYAKQLIFWRKVLMARSLARVFNRTTQTVLLELRIKMSLNSTGKQLLAKGLQIMMISRKLRAKKDLLVGLAAWREYSSAASQKELRLKMHILNGRKSLQLEAINHWKNAVEYGAFNTERGLDILTKMLMHRDAQLKSLGIRMWKAWVGDNVANQSLQVALNANMLNDNLVRSLEQVPAHKGCILLSHWIDNFNFRRRIIALQNLKLNADRKNRAFVMQREKSYKNRLACISLYLITKQLVHKSLSSSKDLLWHNLINKKNASKEHQAMLRGKTAHVRMAAIIFSSVQRIRLRCLQFGFTRLLKRNMEVNALGSVARLLVLNKVLLVVCRYQTSLKAFAIQALQSSNRNNLDSSAQMVVTQAMESSALVLSMAKPGRCIKASSPSEATTTAGRQTMSLGSFDKTSQPLLFQFASKVETKKFVTATRTRHIQIMRGKMISKNVRVFYGERATLIKQWLHQRDKDQRSHTNNYFPDEAAQSFCSQVSFDRQYMPQSDYGDIDSVYEDSLNRIDDENDLLDTTWVQSPTYQMQLEIARKNALGFARKLSSKSRDDRSESDYMMMSTNEVPKKVFYAANVDHPNAPFYKIANSSISSTPRSLTNKGYNINSRSTMESGRDLPNLTTNKYFGMISNYK